MRSTRKCATSFPRLDFHPEIGSIRDPRRLEEVFREHYPIRRCTTPPPTNTCRMMEAHLFEALENNVFGTRNVAERRRGIRRRRFCARQLR